MRIPTRKQGNYAGFKPDPHMTRRKYDELGKSMEKLKRISRPSAIEEVMRLAADGDFSENAAYQIAKSRLRGINRRILEIEGQLKRAVIIEPRKESDVVVLGSSVKVEVDGKEKRYLILGSSETDPAGGVISHNSPIGAALMGHKAGESVTVKLGNAIKEYRILRINS